MSDYNNDSLKLAEILFPDVEKNIDYYEKLYPPREVDPTIKITRFAPSPTGFIHIGGVYAALVSSLVAHQSKGVFFLRIEDTDKKREVKNGVEEIINGLLNFNIIPDEGVVAVDKELGAYGPYKQSERISIYRIFAKELVKRGVAYPCFCTLEELENSRKMQEAKKIKPGYYGEWAIHRNLNLDEIKKALIQKNKFALRLKTEINSNKQLLIKDLIKGELTLPVNDLDIVLLKSDNLPTYHFAHFVDDYLMRVTHVIRGDEWLSSLPIHLQLFQLFVVKPPIYGHISPIVKTIGSSKRKLSKRKDPEAAVSFYLEKGYPAESVTEYLLNLANSDFEDWREKYPFERIEKFPFNIEKMGKSWSNFDIDKLNFTSKNVISRMSIDEIYKNLLKWANTYDNEFAKVLTTNKEYLKKIINIENSEKQQRKDLQSWSEVREKFGYFFDQLVSDVDIKNYLFPLDISNQEIKQIFSYFIENYTDTDTREEWLDKSKNFFSQMGFAKDTKEYKENKDKYRGNLGTPFMALRVALTGVTKTPDLFEIMRAMGNERVKARLKMVVNHLDKSDNQEASLSITPELKEFSRELSCWFLDYKTTSKDYVKESLMKNQDSFKDIKNDYFVISTCLRYEVYIFGKNEKINENFILAKNKLALRRLLSLICGLQSEIIGEKEVLSQVKAAIDTGYANNTLTTKSYKALLDIVEIGLKIRDIYDINSDENYSTIGAEILEEKISENNNPIIMIIGGGYMANSFLSKTISKVNKLIWINRDIEKIKKRSESFENIQRGSIIFASPSECSNYFPIADAIFCAVSNSPYHFEDRELNKINFGCQIVDISYPPVFNTREGLDITNISNTHFDKLVKKIIPKTAINAANLKIDEVLEKIFGNDL